MTPALTTERPQHLQALERANEIRLFRAALKRRIAAGELDAQAVLTDPHEHLHNMTIGELLRAQHRWGRHRVRKLLVAHAINENRPLHRLTERQRRLVAEALGS